MCVIKNLYPTNNINADTIKLGIKLSRKSMNWFPLLMVKSAPKNQFAKLNSQENARDEVCIKVFMLAFNSLKHYPSTRQLGNGFVRDRYKNYLPHIL